MGEIMCTAIAYGEKNRYFGRNLDYERGFGEQVVVTPRNFPLEYRFLPQQRKHYAFIGMASVMEGYPLYYEASNERGLSVAGLNFVGNCRFCNVTLDLHVNLCQFEIVPYIMAKCASVDEAKAVLKRINLVGERFLPDLPLAELHWMLCDSEQCAVLEITREGAIEIYRYHLARVTSGAPAELNALLRECKVGVGTHQGKASRAMVGSDNNESAWVALSILHSDLDSAHEAAHLRLLGYSVVAMSHAVDKRALDHEHKALVATTALEQLEGFRCSL